MEKYTRFVMERIDKESPREELRGQVFLGTGGFVSRRPGLKVTSKIQRGCLDFEDMR